MRCRTCTYGIPSKDRWLSAVIGLEAALLGYFSGILFSVRIGAWPIGVWESISVILGVSVYFFTLWRVKNSACPVCPRK